MTKPSLELRRLHADLIFCYRIVFSLTDLQVSEFFETAAHSTTRGHNHELFKTRCSANAQSKFFSDRVVNCWNDLPVTVDFSSLASFTRSVKCVHLPDYFRCFK